MRQRKLVQVNVTAGRGSTGVIADEIGRLAVARGWDSTIVYGREPHGESTSRLIRVGDDMDMRRHGLMTRLFDAQGLASRRATRRLVRQLSELGPDVVHLHNIHGYYLNYPILFRWLKEWGGSVVWTLHDIWPLTGHCAYFGVQECRKWRTECDRCPRLKTYPASVMLDRSRRNFRLKKELFSSLPNLTLVTVSDWLSDLVSHSFLSDVKRVTIHNGVDLEVFTPSAVEPLQPYVLGVANVWEERKGLADFIELRKLLPAHIGIKLVGLTLEQIKELPEGIEGIRRMSSREELAELYAGALAFVNPTYEDNFPTVNIEALASSTPVITYRTGGSPEAIDGGTGFVVEQGDILGLSEAVKRIMESNIVAMKNQCRARAMELFSKNDRYADYMRLYAELTSVNGGGYLLCVASVWTREKGFEDIKRLRELLPDEELIVMVGVSAEQIEQLPEGIIGLRRTADRRELAVLYSGADAFVNSTWGDNFPTVNIEALACGTPVVTYRTGGSPEAVDAGTGIVVERGDVQGLAEAVGRAERLNPADCRARALALFNKNDRYAEYLKLYDEILQ